VRPADCAGPVAGCGGWLLGFLEAAGQATSAAARPSTARKVVRITGWSSSGVSSQRGRDTGLRILCCLTAPWSDGVATGHGHGPSAPQPGRTPTVITGPVARQGHLDQRPPPRSTPRSAVGVGHTRRAGAAVERDGEHLFLPEAPPLRATGAEAGVAGMRTRIRGQCSIGTPRQAGGDAPGGRPAGALEIDWRGARQVRRQFPPGFSVLIKRRLCRIWSGASHAARPTAAAAQRRLQRGPAWSFFRPKRIRMPCW